ncbi:MAG: PEP/pyruvate-binding domain-containing protein [Thermodesulfobacteriota bacterium]
MKALDSPVLYALSRLVRKVTGGTRNPAPRAESRFRFKYVSFQELLESNSELLRVIAAMEEKLPGREVFGMSFLHASASQSVFHCLRMVRGFENLSGKQQPVLHAKISAIRDGLKAILSVGSQQPGPWFKDLRETSMIDSDLVGGKFSNLGEARNALGLPCPEGFAVTTSGFRAFLEHSGLGGEIAKRCMDLDPAEPASIQAASEDIQRMMLLAPFPEGFESELLERHSALSARLGVEPGALKVAMRSSAVGEDGELSFAGQYLSILGVARPRLAESYRYVAASLYTPRAMAYRLLKGVPDEASAMSVACLSMVESRASGVMYTRHPFDTDDEAMLVNAVWGLGPYAVDGVVTPDRYRVDGKTLEILSMEASRKDVRLMVKPGGGVEEQTVDRSLAGERCLDPGSLRELAGWGVRLAEHFGKPQDVEWAVDQRGRLMLLQTRPLADAPGSPDKATPSPAMAGREVILEGGETACPGAGCGEVFVVRDDDCLSRFPEGAVLVASHSSPRFMVAMKKARAIVTDHGSITGHMASLSREFGVPTILGMGRAVACLPEGATVTVDACNRRVYAGRVEELLVKAEAPPAPMRGTQVLGLLQEIYSLTGPLGLLDPGSPGFTPENCRTLHDITRYLHEKSYAEMFTLGDQASGEGGLAVRLEAGVGLDLHVIDLGGGLAEEAVERGTARKDEILSRPFRALLEGLADEAFVAKGPRPLHLRGFLSVMGRQMVDGPNMGAERFGERSYAMISDRYLNFSSRVGYHYGVLDCYCGRTINKNYITFAFKGGAAGEDRRERRARAISLILSRLGFTVTVNADRVEGRFQKYPPEVVEEKLVMLGRLLQFTRQTDMLMTSEGAVAAMADSFLRGEAVFGVDG